ncbi:hypothetical protein EG359_19975 [Chryseobacterium joostei]|uniref:DUF8188 domain-containing protein n=1 Tax=Chryseobacterium joostei TaxID=112234 RepID=A0A1N7J5Z8_9FLAO|nr:hypothetical protein [Chryseobacterium joostei]AZB01741.1 hypothetical protein EG359_19975 [Chryseobacterium joostei]SIS44783.1 hypothetical protein SAMN05421768_107367 [Chryseobacterium joostei]
MKGSTIGYIVGLVVGVPLFAFGANYLFFSGNRASDIETQEYIKNSKIETFAVNKWLKEDHKQYIAGLQRGANSAVLYWYTFYDNQYKKYFNLYMFDYLEANQQGRLRIDFLYKINDTTRFRAYVNQEQLKNPAYGTKDNPVPVWGKDLLELNGRLNESIELEAKTFHISPETNAIFIEQYLSRFMPKDEYRAMFKK